MGLTKTLGFILKRLLEKGKTGSPLGTGKINVNEFYRFIYDVPFGQPQVDYPEVVTWIIPDFGIGSGGHLNIFRIVYFLERSGIKCHVNIDAACHFSRSEDARKSIRKHFFPIQADVTIGRDALRPSAITVATSWTTAYTMRDFQATAHKFYFVQDYEPYFYSKGSEYQFAEDTYSFGLKAITAGSWLSDKLSKEFGMEAHPFGFSFDKQLYKRAIKRDKKKRVFFYSRPVTCRRGFELGLLVLEEVTKKLPELEIVFAGWDSSGYEIPFPYLNAGVLSLPELPDLYAQCDVALVISFTNLSLLPLELMACGCVVVSNKGKNVEWLLNEEIAVLADANVKALSGALIDVLNESGKRNDLSVAGEQFALNTSWEAEAKKVAGIFEKHLE